MANAWIRGNPTTLEAAIERAATLLQASRMPVIAGLGTDVAGARAAIALGERIGAAVDHMHSAALLRDLDVMREAAMMVTTPNETRLRADLLLLVGPGLIESWPDLPARLFDTPAASGGTSGSERRIVWLCPGRSEKSAGSRIEVVGDDPADLPVLLAALRARVAGRPVGKALLDARQVDALAADLPKARFGVAVWSARAHDGLTIEMLCGLVKDLNERTRFSGLPLAPGDNAAAVQQVSGWMTGFPLRTGFGRGLPEHDPWRFDAVRLVDSGEADCALWIAATGAVKPAWNRDVPLIVLAQSPDGFRRPPEVAIAVGQPGIDHDSVEHLAATGTLAGVSARQPTSAITVADTVGRIAAALPVARSC
jgi:formylmethanofuran dehydrogenase subunit B